jgi:Fe-S-cluster containining protein
MGGAEVHVKPHPCRTCGACCATFRVSFYRGDTDASFGVVPDALTEPVTPFLVAMRGTNQTPSRCVALEGDVGRETTCTIHALRPGPCREFAASWEDGTPHDRCDAARARWGLPALEPGDWA